MNNFNSFYKLLTTVIYFGIFTIFYSLTYSQTWITTNGPQKAIEVLDISIGKNTTLGQRIYVANENELLRYSANSGLTWNSTTDTFPGDPLLVATCKYNPGIVFGNRWQSFIHYSSNGGNYWSGVTPIDIMYPKRIAVSSGDSSIAFVGTLYHDLDSTKTSLYRWDEVRDEFDFDEFFRDYAHTYVNDILPYPRSDSARYVWVGGSSNNIITEDVDDADELELVIRRKGIWKSTDAGATWTWKYLGSNIPSNVTALAFSYKSNSNRHLLAAAKNSANTYFIIRSSDMGESWAKLNTDGIGNDIKIVLSLKVHPTKPETLVAATDKGFAYSTNRGVNWSLRNSGLIDLDAHNVVFGLNGGDTVFLATYTSMYRSTNFGVSWTHIPSGTKALNTQAVSIYNGTMNAVFGKNQYGSYYSGISTYSGGTWTFPVSVGTEINNYGDYLRYFTGNAIAINPRYPDYAYACGEYNGKYRMYMRTTSGGNWTSKISTSSSNTAFYCVAADQKNNSQRVYIGGNGPNSNNDNFWSSADKGENWTSSKIGTDGSKPIYCLAIDTSRGISYSNVLYAGLGIGKGVYKSTDGGTSWDLQRLSGHSINAIVVNPGTVVKARTVYVAGDTNIWKSTDSMYSLSTLTTPFKGAKKMIMHPSYSSSVNNLMVLTANGDSIFQTNNGGMNWTPINTSGIPKPILDLKTDAANKQFIYIGTAAGVYYLDPAPLTPTNVAKIIPESVHPKFTWDANTEDDFKEYKIYKQLSGSPYYIATQTSTTFEDLNEYNDGEQEATYYVKAVDDGNNSSELSGGVTFNVAGGGQAKVRTSNLRELPKEFSLEQNYPNPFNPSTTIKFALPVDANVTVKIFDMSGKEIVPLVSGFCEAGYYEASFEAKKLASGVYIYKLTAGNFTDMKKMVLMK